MPAPRPAAPRRAVVCGGGGVLGFAWMIGALRALELETGLDVREAEVVLGTSAGSVVAALVGCGLSVEQIMRHHQGVALPADPTIAWDYARASGGALPPRPSWRLGSPRLLGAALRHPGQVHPMVALSGVLPAGRGDLRPIHDMVATIARDTGHGRTWPERPRPWVVATDFEDGRRVVFGRDRSAPLADAVVASCAIPAWYAPAVVGERRYVDGGTSSNASVDLLAGEGFDEVYVVAPMSARPRVHRPLTPGARIDQALRTAITRGIVRDVRVLAEQGSRVVVLRPGKEDLDMFGVNLMNPARRIEVLDTALRTTVDELRRQLQRAGIGAGPAGRDGRTGSDDASGDVAGSRGATSA